MIERFLRHNDEFSLGGQPPLSDDEQADMVLADDGNPHVAGYAGETYPADRMPSNLNRAETWWPADPDPRQLDTFADDGGPVPDQG